VVNLGYYEGVNSVGEVIEVLKKQKYLGQVFVGITLAPASTRKATKMIDDLAAELAATSRIRRP
jgi:hypothetical protein